jgi:biotin carboxyl carrier protein
MRCRTASSRRAGTIAEICVAAGQAVSRGDALIRFQG